MVSSLNEAYWQRYYYNGGRPKKDEDRIMTADASNYKEDIK